MDKTSTMKSLSTPDGHLKDNNLLLVSQERGDLCPVTGKKKLELESRSRERGRETLTEKEKKRGELFKPEQMVFSTPAIMCALETHYAKPMPFECEVDGKQYNRVQFVLKMRMKNEFVKVQAGTTSISGSSAPPVDPLYDNSAIEYFTEANAEPNLYITGLKIIFN